ncbi:MAG: hypothetical protein H6747_06585 [Deltaproteobacteria bacterium]|nr:hypothetical protein [Deltaproteobacteria bacterium]
MKTASALTALLLVTGCAGGAGEGNSNAKPGTDAGGDDAAVAADTSAVDALQPGTDGAGAGADGSDGGAADTSTEDAGGSTTPCQSDKECAAQAKVCDKKASVCVDCNADEDCGAGAVCIGHSCVVPVGCSSSKDCAATEQVCDKKAGVCVDCLQNEDCAAGTLCVAAVCVEASCAPGATACKDATTLKVCAADGSSWSETPCPSGQACSSGACVTQQICTPGAKSCDGPLTLLTCKADGSGTVATPCGAAQVCASKGGVTSCEAVTCTPGSYVCVGDKIAECNASGEPGDISDDCGAKGKVCDAGVCKEKAPVAICTAGATSCDGDLQKTCKADGTAWETSADCAASGKTCDSGVCKEKTPPPSCTPGEKSCADAVTVATCNGDGSGTTSKACNPNQACVAGACVATLCTPNQKSCNDSKTEKSCAADGKSWTAVQGCQTSNTCAEVACADDKGCVETPLADGASCGEGKVCQGGACVAPSGCQLCGPTETCVGGVCQPCTQVAAPVYIGALRTMPAPTPALPGLNLLTFSPKYQEWWWIERNQNGLPGQCTRYTKAMQPTGKTFPLLPYTRSMEATVDGHYVASFDQSIGYKPIRRIDGPDGNKVWETDATWSQFAAFIAIHGDQVWAFSSSTSEKTKVVRLNLATGAKVGEATYPNPAPSSAFVVGDSFYGGSLYNALGITRWLHDPTYVYVGQVATAAVSVGAASGPHVGFDGRYGCVSLSAMLGRYACFDFYPSCPSQKPAPTTFAGSGLMTHEEQVGLAAQLGVSGETWKRCYLKNYDYSASSQGVPECPAGPTVLLFGVLDATDPSKVFVGGVTSSVGWTTATHKAQDSKLSAFRVGGTVSMVPTSGMATISLPATTKVGVEGLFECVSTTCKWTPNLPAMSCSNGKTGNECAAAVWPKGISTPLHFREAWYKP